MRIALSIVTTILIGLFWDIQSVLSLVGVCAIIYFVGPIFFLGVDKFTEAIEKRL